MQIKLGAKVYNSDDQPLGSVSQVNLYPGSKEISNLVVHKGQADGDHKLVLPDMIYTADEKRVVLRPASAGSTGEMPHLADDLLTESGMQSALSPAVPMEDTVALREGAKVISSDGQNVGNIETIITSENHLTDLLIAKGKLIKSRKMVQVEMISSMMNNEVRLNVNADFVNSLPEPRPDAQPM
jgi:uncharacterized protein YrrD